jgi:hypothetical protein
MCKLATRSNTIRGTTLVESMGASWLNKMGQYISTARALAAAAVGARLGARESGPALERRGSRASGVRESILRRDLLLAGSARNQDGTGPREGTTATVTATAVVVSSSGGDNELGCGREGGATTSTTERRRQRPYRWSFSKCLLLLRRRRRRAAATAEQRQQQQRRRRTRHL